MTPADIKDAESAPWQAERRPDPTPGELALVGAAKVFAKLDDEVQAWDQTVPPRPRSGPDYEALVSLWRERHGELLACARAMSGEKA